MSSVTKRIAGTAGSALLLSAAGVHGALAFANEAPDAVASDANIEQANEGARRTPRMEVTQVQGTFKYFQEETSSIGAISKAVSAAKYLCAANAATLTDTSAEDWTIAIAGDVANAYSITVSELQVDPDIKNLVMGCSCQGNPADGNASFNAKITGASVKTLLEKAGVSESANTVVFSSADGYEIALPLRYVQQHYCPIVFDVNDAPLAESVGGTNQLWLGSTSARYFARDIVSIAVESRNEVPAAPGTPEAGDDYVNLPNVGIAFGGEVS
jgi:DMSO/TMAO reductase YedYZ molybdopterin-dependent catalytic subunit